MEQKLVSVVLCTYNGERFLQEQVESILRQTYQPLELIISDDASTDGTQALLKKYEALPNVHIHYQTENVGLTKNFERAAQKAKGDFIAFSDQDDIWVDHKIERLVNAIDDFPLIYSDSLLMTEEGKSMNKKLSDLKRMYTGNDSRGYILYSCVWGHGMMIRRELLQHALPMPANVNHDIWLTYTAFQQGGIKYLDDVLTWYRQHHASFSKTLPPKKTIRSKEKRYVAFKEKLEWVQLMAQHERPEYKPFYDRFVELFAGRERKTYSFSLVGFMFKYRRSFFRLSTKGLADHIVEIVKYGIGEKP